MNRIIALLLGIAVVGAGSANASEGGAGHAPAPFIQEFDNTLAPLQFVKFCMNYASECEPDRDPGTAPAPDSARQILAEVNSSINRSIVARRKSTEPLAAHWEVAPLSGDCNDYAVTKRHALIVRGWPASMLRLAVVVTEQGVGHLVLVVRLGDGDVVLDNLSANIRPWTAVGYQWISMQSAENPRFWVAIDKEGERRHARRLAAASAVNTR